MSSYTHEENKNDALALFEMINSVATSPIPVIGRIMGAALGGGSGLAAACDICFATNNASFGFTEVRLGLIPAVISPFVIRKIGISNCSRYFLTGERFTATEATRIGLVNQAFGTIEELDKAIDKTTKDITDSSPAAVRQAKLLIDRVSSFGTPQSSRDFVVDAIAKIRVSEEGQEGLRSFLNRKPPSWKISN